MYADITNPDRPPDNTVAMPPIPNRAALYIGEGQGEGEENEGQGEEDGREAALRRYADGPGLAVVAVYREMGGPGLARLIEDAQADQFDAVIVASRAAVASDAASYDRLRDAITEVSVRLLVADESLP